MDLCPDSGRLFLCCTATHKVQFKGKAWGFWVLPTVVMGSASVPVPIEYQSILWVYNSRATSERMDQNRGSVKPLLSSALAVSEDPRQENGCQVLDDEPCMHAHLSAGSPQFMGQEICQRQRPQSSGSAGQPAKLSLLNMVLGSQRN